MFAPAAPSHATHAYQRIGVETSVADASAHQLISILFEGYGDALAKARGALLAGRVADKGQAIGHAVRIVEEGLRSALNLRDGGAIAAQLDALYRYVALRLTHANLRNDAAALQECSDLIEPLKTAWLAIDPARAGSTR